MHLTAHLRSGLSAPETVLEFSDMNAFAIWAGRIAGGDVLSRDTYHPYPDWMADVAPLETFEAWWGGRDVFHQTPLYPYLLALSYRATGGKLALLLLQVLGSTLSVYLLYRIGDRMAGEAAGLFAAGLAAVYAPSIFLDTMLLRASLTSTLTLASIWLLLRVRDTRRPGWALGTGMVLAAGFLMRPVGLAMLAGPLVLLLDRGSRATWRRWVPALMGGLAIVLLPFVARNAVVGAPLLKFSTRGAETVIHGNHVAADPAFMTLPGTSEYRNLMEEADGSVVGALGAAIRTWPQEGRVRWWLWHEARKLMAVFRDYEYANNVNFYFFRRATPGLSWLPTFGLVAGLGLVGTGLLAVRTRDRMAGLLMALAALGLIGTMMLAFAAGRYRLPLAMLMTIPAGATSSALVQWARSGRRGAALACVAAVGAITVASRVAVPTRVLFDPSGEPHFIRGADARLYERLAALRVREFAEEARLRAERGQTGSAGALLTGYLAELREVISKMPEPEDRNLRRTIINQTYVQLQWARDMFAERGLDGFAADVDTELEWIRTNT